MTHLAGNCSCGRQIHLSKNAKYGTVWKCHRCAKKWHVSNHGRPLHRRKSKTPPLDVGVGSDGLGYVIGVVLLGLLVYWLFGGIGVVLLVLAGCYAGWLFLFG